MYMMINGIDNREFLMLAAAQRCWKMAVQRTNKKTKMSCRMSDIFIKSSPSSCRRCERVALAMYDTPMPFNCSTRAERASKVVRTRPGWRGAQYGT